MPAPAQLSIVFIFMHPLTYYYCININQLQIHIDALPPTMAEARIFTSLSEALGGVGTGTV